MVSRGPLAIAAGRRLVVPVDLPVSSRRSCKPGVITDLPLANMALSDGGKAMLDVDNLHIKADACGGDVTIRSYVYLRISTASAHTEFAIYGDPMKI